MSEVGLFSYLFPGANGPCFCLMLTIIVTVNNITGVEYKFEMEEVLQISNLFVMNEDSKTKINILFT